MDFHSGSDKMKLPCPRLGEADLQLNMQRITALLKAHGQFPSKYRQLIWRFLLQVVNPDPNSSPNRLADV